MVDDLTSDLTGCFIFERRSSCVTITSSFRWTLETWESGRLLWQNRECKLYSDVVRRRLFRSRVFDRCWFLEYVFERDFRGSLLRFSNILCMWRHMGVPFFLTFYIFRVGLIYFKFLFVLEEVYSSLVTFLMTSCFSVSQNCGGFLVRLKDR